MSLPKKITAGIISISIFFLSFAFYLWHKPQETYANIINLPLTVKTLAFTPKLDKKKYDLALLKGIELDLSKPLNIKFYIDKMNQKQTLAQDNQRLINYFLAFLAIPENKLWVNLSPLEKKRIITDPLGRLDIGKDLLLEDYMLKQIVSLVTNPNTLVGKKFWQAIEKKSLELAHTSKLPIDTCYKVWIVPNIALVGVYKEQQRLMAVVKEAKLRVLMDNDYQIAKSQKGIKLTKKVKAIKDVNDFARELFKKDLLPIIEDQVNNSLNFAGLRQLYYAFILAKYFKDSFRTHPIYKYYIDQERVWPLAKYSSELIKKTIYDSYLKIFKNGAYDQAYNIGNSAKRYFSGGARLGGEIEVKPTTGASAKEIIRSADQLSGHLRPSSSFWQVYDLKHSGKIDLSGQDIISASPAEKYLFFSSLMHIIKAIPDQSAFPKKIMRDIFSAFVDRNPNLYIAQGVKAGFCGLVASEGNNREGLVLGREYFSNVLPKEAKNISRVMIDNYDKEAAAKFLSLENDGQEKYKIIDNILYEKSLNNQGQEIWTKRNDLDSYLTSSKEYLRQIIYYVIKADPKGKTILNLLESYLFSQSEARYAKQKERLAAQTKPQELKIKNLKLIIDEFMKLEFNDGIPMSDTQEIFIADETQESPIPMLTKFNFSFKNFLKAGKTIISNLFSSKSWPEWLWAIAFPLITSIWIDSFLGNIALSLITTLLISVCRNFSQLKLIFSRTSKTASKNKIINRLWVKPKVEIIPNNYYTKGQEREMTKLDSLAYRMIKKHRVRINQALEEEKDRVKAKDFNIKLGLKKSGHIDKDNIILNYYLRQDKQYALTPHKQVIISFCDKEDFFNDAKMYHKAILSLYSNIRKSVTNSLNSNKYYYFYDDKLKAGIHIFKLPEVAMAKDNKKLDKQHKQLKENMRQLEDKVIKSIAASFEDSRKKESLKIKANKLAKIFGPNFVRECINQTYPLLADILSNDIITSLVLEVLLEYHSQQYLEGVINDISNNEGKFKNVANLIKSMVEKRIRPVSNNQNFIKAMKEKIDLLPKGLSLIAKKKIIDLQLKCQIFDKDYNEQPAKKDLLKKKARILFILYLSNQKELDPADTYSLINGLKEELGFTPEEIKYFNILSDRKSLLDKFSTDKYFFVGFFNYIKDLDLLSLLPAHSLEYNVIVDVISLAFIATVIRTDDDNYSQIINALNYYPLAQREDILAVLGRNIVAILKQYSKTKTAISNENFLAFIKLLLNDRNIFQSQGNKLFFLELLKDIESEIRTAKLRLLAQLVDVEESSATHATTIGQYILPKNIKFEKMGKRFTNGAQKYYAVFEAYNIKTNKQETITLRAREETNGLFHEFKRDDNLAINEKIDAFLKEKNPLRLILENNPYGIHGIGQPYLVAIDEKMILDTKGKAAKGYKIALFHELAHAALEARYLDEQDLIKELVYIEYKSGQEIKYFARKALDRYLNSRTYRSQFNGYFRRHYLIRLYQKRWPDDNELNKNIKKADGQNINGGIDFGLNNSVVAVSNNDSLISGAVNSSWNCQYPIEAFQNMTGLQFVSAKEN